MYNVLTPPPFSDFDSLPYPRGKVVPLTVLHQNDTKDVKEIT